VCGDVEDEDCDGRDDDEDTRTDEGACGVPEPDEPCGASRGEPVHVGTGVFTLHPRIDALYAGSPLPMQFTRYYTSREGWPGPYYASTPLHTDRARIAPGWLHTFNERLFKADARSNVALTGTPTTTTIIHRQPWGTGRPFTCPGAWTGGDFTCTSSDGSFEELSYDSGTAVFTLKGHDGVYTKFSSSGLLTRKQIGSAAAGFGWTVTYDTSAGALAGFIAYVQDDYGRRMNFVWVVPPVGDGRPYLSELRDAGGTLLATFTYSPTVQFLASAQSAAQGTETYAYASGTTAAGNAVWWPYLTTVNVGGANTISVTYDNSGSNSGRGLAKTYDAFGLS
jgi:hypothetical protein